MSTIEPPSKAGTPVAIQDGDSLRFGRWSSGAFGGSLFFHRTRVIDGRRFPWMSRVMLFRSPSDDAQRRQGSRTILFPGMLFLTNYALDHRRGLVLELCNITFTAPPSWARKSEMHVPRSYTWITDVALCGVDLSHQTWCHHLPPRFYRRTIEDGERWLFGLKKNDRLLAEK
jgi:hypothetical protein